MKGEASTVGEDMSMRRTQEVDAGPSEGTEGDPRWAVGSISGRRVKETLRSAARMQIALPSGWSRKCEAW